MTRAPTRPRLLALLRWLGQHRYIKFGLVGASGTGVNLAVLYLAREYLFKALEGQQSRPYFSLALAIAVATLNNFTWNRAWTWADRSGPESGALSLLKQFGKYAAASWFGIVFQYALTLWLSTSMHYMLANLLAIVIASVCNFVANDRWTFKRR